MDLLRIADSFIVLKHPISEQEKMQFAHIFQTDYMRRGKRLIPASDYELSKALSYEFTEDEYPFKPAFYINELKNDKMQRTFMRHNAHWKFQYANFLVDDFQVSQAFKNSGLKIKNNIEVYRVKYNSNKKEYEFFDECNRKTEINKTHAYANTEGIFFNLKMFAFSNEDISNLQRIKKLKEQNISEDLFSEKDKALWEIYTFVQQEISTDEQEKPFTFVHEMTHIRNALSDNKANLSQTRSSMSTTEQYFLQIHDEKSASLAVNLQAIKLYLQKGDLEDFSMFPKNSSWLVEDLKKHSPEERLNLLTNYQYLVMQNSVYWDKHYRKSYFYQNKNLLLNWASKTEAFFVNENSDGKEYCKRLSQRYTLKYFNPKIQAEDILDFSRYFKDDFMLSKAEAEHIIVPAMRTITHRQHLLTQSNISASEVKRLRHLLMQNPVINSQKDMGY